MKILFFTYDFPYPTTSGGKNRAYNMLKFAQKNNSYILFSFYREIPDKEDIREIEKLSVERIHLFKRDFAGIGRQLSSPKNVLSHLPSFIHFLNPTESITRKLYFKKQIATELINTVQHEKIDLVHFESLYTAYYLSPAISQFGVPQVFGSENIEYAQYEDFAKKKANKMLSPFYVLEAKKIRRDERKLFSLADSILAVSDSDKKKIEKECHKKVTLIENGVDLEYFSLEKRSMKEKKLLFVGNFSYFPNVDAITHFYQVVFPALSGLMPTLVVVGRHASSLPFASDAHVETFEFVDDIRKAYESASVFIFPVRIGGGTNFKLLEAMATGVPVVAYNEKAKSIGATPGIQLLGADDPQAFAAQVLKLLGDEKEALTIALAARKFVEEHYSWKALGLKLHSHWEELVHAAKN